MWFQQIYVLSIALAAACSAAFGDMFLKMSA
jgi:hypothetical protein